MPTENLTNILFRHWQHTLQPFGVNNINLETAFADLVDSYSAAHRYYHNLKHIHNVLEIIETLKTYTDNLPAVQLAAWLHDIVYDPQAKDNEEKSAEYADKFLRNLGVPITEINTVKRLILNTKHHQADIDDLDSQVLLDADLGILAVNPQKYREYADAIRLEYSWLSTREYVIARQQVLQKFLQRSNIYFTPLMLEFAELFARYNLNTEIQLLSWEHESIYPAKN
jgi:predicted metal-dependent HD superfamily phosphohydrolase